MANQRGIITFQTPKKCMKVRRLVPPDSNDEESGEGSDVARGPQVPHKQQIPRVTVSKTKPKIHSNSKSKIQSNSKSKSKSKSKLATKINTRSAESQNRGEYQYEEFVRRFGQYVDITSEGLHKCTLCEYVNPPKGKGRENVMEHVEKRHFPDTLVYIRSLPEELHLA